MQIQVDEIKLYCGNCIDFITIEKKDVQITLDLSEDRLNFNSICPSCRKDIYNTRLIRVF